MQQEQRQSRAFTRRVALLAGGKTLLLSALVGRMYYLQVLESDRYTVLAEENRINLRLLPPPRGRILDRFGELLAVNDQNYRLVVVAEQTPDLEATLDAVASLISLAASERERTLREHARKRAFVPITVRENLTWDEVARIEVNAPDLPGIGIEMGESREYPYGGATAHILGYVAAVAETEQTGDPLLELPGFRIGKNGIEKQYDSGLRGKAGSSQVEVNAVGRIIRELSRKEGEPGRDVVVTLDSGLQQFVQQRLASELSGSAVVLDVRTGDVLALGSTPTFDPAAFGRGLSQREWQALISDPQLPLSNKAIAGQYAPGSTFKMMVALAALDSGVGPDFNSYCPGFLQLGNARFHCWKKEGHGNLTMIDGIKHSCDVYFYNLARRIGVDAIAAMSRRFGLGQAEGLDLPGERAGVIPDVNWKRATMGQPWYPGETLIAGIGQGYVLTTPLQLAVMTARIANGGFAVVPRLTREAVAGDAVAQPSTAFASLGLAAAHLDVVREGMKRVTNDPRGTAYRVRIEQPGMEMAGKTGTAQVRRITLSERLSGVMKNENLPWNRRDHALFVGYAPLEAPRYAVAVVIEHGGGGSKVAGPIARDILIETQLRDPSRARPPAQVAWVSPR
ncbi:MAG: penicillin-binding protein 2 [Dongiaceae bacterium]